ncbi:Lrp/AsnC family transcriptional regulator, regulator for asnA, asnC and gidA [Ruegeria halocynthiae]|uniref:Lrp/AsnC family transcriptional regulator, regulator for asnA, asnC and gidA n=1 Tax=Ruegeria halocynthiae TaxID=985054 RepID=A0A1H3FNS5_9RHOB|nr:Lrp/AsnC family transcriptional regulator [Ruegeria halocynthiae]SDX92048.1 Lrp/AsnC family transcriptional regulator, regulator for asnA, asnC and gidA [Ruegeria halocynthiae]
MAVKKQSNLRATQSIRSPGDDLNQQIIRLLQQDGRMAFSEIAQQLDVSEGTIRNRVSGLRDNNMLRIVAMSDPVATEYTTDAMIGLNVAAGVTPRQVAERLEKNPRVVFILWVAGRYDLIIELVSDDGDALKEFLEREIHASDDIANADVMPGLKNFKNQFLLKQDMKE